LVDDEADVAELFRQGFRREARQGTYVLHSPTRVTRRWRCLTKRSIRNCLRCYPTSTCRGWTD
jgi:hypothetical protein